MTRQLPDFIAVGVVVKAHGIKGELNVKPLTHSPSRFNHLSQVQVERRDGQVSQMLVEAVSVQGDVVYLRLKGIETRKEAAALRGAFLSIARADLLPLDKDEFYLFEAVGCRVKTSSGDFLGHVTDVLDLSSSPIFVVKSGEKEYLIPAIKDVVLNLDLENEEIIIEPLAGLLD